MRQFIFYTRKNYFQFTLEELPLVLWNMTFVGFYNENYVVHPNKMISNKNIN